MIRKILLALLFAVIGLAVYIHFRPADFKITRSAVFSAAPDVVFPHINDLQNWQAWSPWAKRDPNAKNTFSGPTAGKDAAFSWVGNSDVGEGKMTITESKPSELVRFKLEFIKPFASTCDTEFSLQPDAAGTKVTWTMTGKNEFIGKAMSLFMNCDKMIGGDFEQGFANLQGVLSKGANP